LRHTPEVRRLLERRRLLQSAAAGTVLAALGGFAVLLGDSAAANAETRADGRPRVPPGQHVIKRLKPMGGDEGDPTASAWRLRVHGAVENPFELDFDGLLAMTQTELATDVHCVTGWSVLGASFKGVLLSAIAERAQPKKKARHVIFEGAHGYTANVPLREALAPNVMIAHRLDDKPLSAAHGAPVRAIVPELYFWKSAKWLEGIRFQKKDEPGFWEVRGYNNHGDPWKEERYG
jgi:DMSO/TMAO reductase YedYZ molybdopterin-dependent catalytic subunit